MVDLGCSDGAKTLQISVFGYLFRLKHQSDKLGSQILVNCYGGPGLLGE